MCESGYGEWRSGSYTETKSVQLCAWEFGEPDNPFGVSPVSDGNSTSTN